LAVASIGFDAADKSLSLPYLAVHGLVETPSGFERRSVIRGVNPFGGPNFSGPVETIDSISCHSCAPRRQPLVSSNEEAVQFDAATIKSSLAIAA
jgi:hypothetical protein